MTCFVLPVFDNLHLLYCIQWAYSEFIDIQPGPKASNEFVIILKKGKGYSVYMILHRLPGVSSQSPYLFSKS